MVCQALPEVHCIGVHAAGHQSHLDPELVWTAQREGVIFLCLLPHVSHPAAFGCEFLQTLVGRFLWSYRRSVSSGPLFLGSQVGVFKDPKRLLPEA